MLTLTEKYERDGFIGPIQAFSPDRMSQLLDELERDVFAKKGIAFSRNRHLDLSSVDLLCQSSVIYESIEQILGKDLTLWRSNFFAMKQGMGLGWHQDQYNTLIEDTAKQVSVHLGITQSFPDNCLSVIPGSHKWPSSELKQKGFTLIPGTEKDSYGTPHFEREPQIEINKVPILLQPGEFIVFHPQLMHGSIDRKASNHSHEMSQRFKKTSPISKALHKLSRAMESWNDRPHSEKKNPSTVRLALGMRVTTPEVEVYPKAFQQTLPRVDKCVPLTGETKKYEDEIKNYMTTEV
ncbi:phytanoyl-CoA dioxygenase family protein [Synechococcus sp. PCC 7336]|uniref:phytanoyl-CoA dioxygenase family protein n=1 Tax=Synechococcus sp. PCC 7336 TaxID=195250 RepID=UPI00034C00B7|nr:phytanoyl-CoA dioxygenase family protein [Synechococcus sp. PCC 7336]